MRARLALLPCLVLCLGAATRVVAKDEAGPSTIEPAAELIVMLRGENDEPMGAGIVVGRRRDRLYVVTADHVVRRGAVTTPVTASFRGAPAVRFATVLQPDHDRDLDLALLEVPIPAARGVDACKLDFARLPLPDAHRRGDDVYPVGFPNGVAWAAPVVPDRISRVDPGSIEFQTQFLSPGHSGGALLDADGRILGMIRADQPPFGVALRIETLLARVAQWNVAPRLFTPYEYDRQPLHIAADAGDVAAIEDQLTDCGRVDDRSTRGETALHFAAARGRDAAIAKLLERGANPNLVDEDGDTALHYAIESGRVRAVKLLLAGKTDPNLTNGRRETAVFHAIDTRVEDAAVRDEVLRLVLAGGGSPDRPSWKTTPLNEAIARRRGELVLALLDARAKATSSDLSLAIQNGDTAIVTRLLSASPGVAAPKAYPLVPSNDQTYDTPLNTAVRAKRIDLVRALLAAGADPDLAGNDDLTALAVALYAGSSDDIVDLLIARKAGLGRLDRSRAETVLLDAVTRSRAETVRILLAHGARPNSTGGRALVDTLLEIAIKRGDVRTVGLLAGAGADVNAWRIGTPLAQAVRRNDSAMVEQLLRARADPNLGGLDPPPLWLAIEAKSSVMTRMLLAAGADPRARYRDKTMQQFAEESGSADVATLVRAAASTAKR